MAKYYGEFSANNGSTYVREPYEYRNKKIANKEMREMAIGNTYAGNSCKWRVQDELGRTVYEGAFYPGIGISYSVFDYIM